MDISYLCSQIVLIIQGCIRILDSKGQTTANYGEGNAEYDPFIMDRAFLKEVLKRPLRSCPDIFYEEEHIFYGMIPLEDGGRLLAGPVSIVRENGRLAEYMAQTHHFLHRENYRLSYCGLRTFGAGMLLLYHGITGNTLSLNELWRLNGIDNGLIEDARRSITKVIFQKQETQIPYNPYAQEVREMDSIRRGDVEMLRKSLEETYVGEVGKLSPDKLRSIKNTGICVISLAVRAAIDGGMLPDQAFAMGDGYILKMEEMTNILKIVAMIRQAEFEFAEEVSRIKKKSGKNELTDRAKKYIFEHLHSNLVIRDISRNLGVNPDYLSDLFHRTEGITLQQYIRKEKIALAENLLRFSNYEIQEIAAYLSFCSQSHFGKVFKEITGMTPLRYREKYGAGNH